jgi:hypothetical protein
MAGGNQMKLRLVNIETPFAGDIERNIKYARACMRDCILRGEAPIASHLLYTQEGILDDQNAEERKRGMECGFAWNEYASATIVYVDLGISRGMQAGIDAAVQSMRETEYRRLGANW